MVSYQNQPISLKQKKGVVQLREFSNLTVATKLISGVLKMELDDLTSESKPHDPLK